MGDENNQISMQGAVCPVPLAHGEQIVLGHGSGGKMMHDLIAKFFMPPFDNPALRAGDDAGVVQPNPCTRFAISTDSHVVSPLFFPGGDIGRLAVCGTVNDLAMMGAMPLYLSAGFILEEGLEIEILGRVIESMRTAAQEAGVQIVAGDTKVVQKGKGDGLYINTTGVGTLELGLEIGGAGAHPGDAVILSGPIGDHGIAVLSARGDPSTSSGLALGIETNVQSDVAPLNHLVSTMLAASDQIHVLRDPTRGGVAMTLNEIAKQSNVGIVIEEKRIPVRAEVSAVCELLGFDPLYIANEGKLIALVGREDADRVVDAMRVSRYGEGTVIIGEVRDEPRGRVLLKTEIGSTRVVDVLMGELLPRIC